MPKLTRSRHNLSHHRLLTFDGGYLVPIACMEVLMGDTFVHQTRALLRAATLVTPVMHPVDVRIHHWYVPNRILWDDWDEFITGQDPELVIPTITFDADVHDYGLLDHFGVPKHDGIEVNALPIRAYNAIWNEFYRDQDLMSAADPDDLTLKRVCWQKDYFTSARATPQQGSAIKIPFAAGVKAPVLGIGLESTWSASSEVSFLQTDGTTYTGPGDAADEFNEQLVVATETSGSVGPNNKPQIFADLSQAEGGGIDINEFRMAMAMQRHLEARNRYGSRIQDYLAYHGIRPRDGRLDLPEYLGGGKQTISFSEVLATAEGNNTDVGDMAGHGIAALRTRRYGRFFAESGWLISVMSVRPRTMYMQQFHRQWLRRVKDDYWQKEYEYFGPQAVLVKEVYGLHANATDVFGYNGRHDEYRRHPSYVSGAFRDSTDDMWHMARSFDQSPVLNQSFVECVPTDRIYADTSEPEFRAMVAHDIRAKRLVSKRARY